MLKALKSLFSTVRSFLSPRPALKQKDDNSAKVAELEAEIKRLQQKIDKIEGDEYNIPLTKGMLDRLMENNALPRGDWSARMDVKRAEMSEEGANLPAPIPQEELSELWSVAREKRKLDKIEKAKRFAEVFTRDEEPPPGSDFIEVRLTDYGRWKKDFLDRVDFLDCVDDAEQEKESGSGKDVHKAIDELGDVLPLTVKLRTATRW